MSEAPGEEEQAWLPLALEAGAVAGAWMWVSVGAQGRLTGDARLAQTFGLDALALARGVPVATLFGAIAPGDRRRAAAAIAQAAAQGGKCRFEFRVLVNGQPRWFEATGRCDLDASGRAIRFPGVVIDIDRGKRQSLRQAALVELGDRLRGLERAEEIEETAAAILCRELHATCAGYGRVDEAGAGFLIAAPYQASRQGGSEALTGFHSFADYGHYAPLLEEGRLVAVADVRTDPLTRDALARFSDLGFLAALKVPLYKAGRLVGVMCVYSAEPRAWTEEDIVFARAVVDRTHAAMRRGRTQQELRAENAALEGRVRQRTRERDRLWSIAKDLFVIISRAGAYLAVSPSWTRALGYPQERLVGLRVDTLCHPADKAAVRAAFDRARNGGVWTDIELDVRLRHADGRWLTYAWNFNNEGATIYGVGRDLTERNELEEQFRQSQKMEAVGQLTGGIAHDFNNLLAGIGGSLELMQMKLARGRPPEEIERYIEVSREAVRRAASLTHRLLAFSRRQTLDPVPTDVNALLTGLQALIRGSVGPVLSIVFDLQERLWTVKVDPNQLENAVLNLCINARDAMLEARPGGGGTLRIATRNRPSGEAEAAGEHVLITVEDDGCGMSEETARRAFDPFFTTKPQGKGTGLGLSMIYGFARQSGGSVGLRSVPGEGTEVRLRLPRHAGREPDGADLPDASPDRERLAARLSGRTVLVVDDEESVRMVVADTLRDLGATVLAAGDAASALTLLEGRRDLALVVTDIGMPGDMNGRQLARRVRARHPGLPVLLMTGYADLVLPREVPREVPREAAGGEGLLLKPFPVEALLARLSRLFAGR